MTQIQLIKTRFLSISLYFGFLVSGIVTVLAGQILPILAPRFSLNDTQAGYFFTAQFSGSIAGTLMMQKLIRRFGYINSISFGFMAIALGTALLNADNWLICLFAFFLNGIGIGITLPAINMLTVELNPTKITPALNFLNFFWGIGAIFCKPFIDFFSTQTSIFTPTIILVGLLLFSGLAIALAPRKTIEAEYTGENSNDDLIPIWTTSMAWLIAIFNLIHVGFESGAGGWLTTYANRLSDQHSAISWLPPTSAYFLFFVIGRLIAPLYSRFLNENKMLMLSLIVTTLGVIVLLLGNDLNLIILGAAIAGFGTSSIFPTNMARFTKIFGQSATRRATPIFICGTLGASLITPLIGYISTSYDNLRIGMFVLFASCLILINLQIMLALKSPKTHTPNI